MKAILIAIQPKYVADILNGKKTLEIRKTMPKCDLPIEVYIYCTKNQGKKNYLAKTKRDLSTNEIVEETKLNGKVVAKFTLNKVEEIKNDPNPIFYTDTLDDYDLSSKSCVCQCDIRCYLEDNDYKYKGYAWHIDNLVVFDKPKELSEFKTHLGYNKSINCMFCKYYVFKECTRPKYLTRAPQSWCYVEV